MKKRLPIVSLILITTVSIVTLGLGWHNRFDASTQKPNNLIACENHVDENFDMVCDSCAKNLPKGYGFKEQKLEKTTEDGIIAKIEGFMPENASILFNDIEKEKAQILIKNKDVTVKDEDIITAYDISIKSNDKKYQPAEHGKEVSINISNLNLDLEKQYAMLHIKENGKVEVIRLSEVTENEIKFNATSFSTYILITVDSYNLTFNGDDNFAIKASNGTTIQNGATLTGTINFSFIVEPAEGYLIKSVTLENASGTDKSNLLEITNNNDNKNCVITSITENLIINIETEKANITRSDKFYYRVGVIYKETLEEAYNEISGDNGVIEVMEDNVDMSNFVIESGKTVTININGKTLTKSTSSIINNGTLIIEGTGTIQTQGANINTLETLIENNGVLTLNGGTLNHNGKTEGKWHVITAAEKSVVNVNGATLNLILTNGVTSAEDINNISTIEIGDGTLNMTSGNVINSYAGSAIKSNAYGKGMINIAGGNVTSSNTENGIGIYIKSANETIGSDLKITGGTVAAGKNAVYSNVKNIIKVEGGELISNNGIALLNDGMSTITIGNDDGEVSAETPKLKGKEYAIKSELKFSLYDGVLRGKTAAYAEKPNQMAEGYKLKSYEEDEYEVVYLFKKLDYSIVKHPETVTAKENETVSFEVIGSGEVVTYRWLYKESLDAFEWAEVPASMGSGVDTDTLTLKADSRYDGYSFRCIVTGDIEEISNIALLYVVDDEIADIYLNTNYKVNEKYYTNLESAYEAITTNEGTILVVQDVLEETELIIEDGKDITLDTNGKTIELKQSTITNKGTLTIGGEGNIRTNAVDKLIQNEGSLIVLNGSYINTNGVAIKNTNGNLIIGVENKEISQIIPEISGATYAIDSNTMFEFYDGMLKGKTAAYVATSVKIQENCILNRSADEIDGVEYKVASILEVLPTKESMVTEWTIPEDNTEIKLPVSGEDLYLEINWGDGTGDVWTNETTLPTHTYEKAGVYNISIKGVCQKWGFNESTEPTSSNRDSNYYTYTQYITGLKQWGELSATNYGFSYCRNLKYVSGDATENTFDKVDNMSYMFNCCTNLETIDLSKFDTSNVKYMGYLFNECSSLKSLDVTSFDTSKVTDMKYMFKNCNQISKLDLSKFNTSNVTTMEYMFQSCSALIKLDLNNFDTSEVIDMRFMFSKCSKLTILNIDNFNTAKAVNMSSMFADCLKLTTLDISNFNTENATRMDNMFYGCEEVTNLDVSNFNTSKVTNMAGMFAKCKNLNELDLSNFNTSKVTSMISMFVGCNNLTNLDLSSFDTSKVTTMAYMLASCENLEAAELSSFETNNNTNMTEMFNNSMKLKSIQISDKFVISQNSTNIFNGCNNLTAIITTSSTPVLNQFNGALPATATLYVPNGSEKVYAETLSGDSSVTVAPILQIVGEENVSLLKGETYEEKLCTVAGFTPNQSEKYAVYGYQLEGVEGSVNTNEAGEYQITYTLTRTYEDENGAIKKSTNKAIRTVTVYDRASAKLYENSEIYDGEWTNQDVVAVVKPLATETSWIEVKVGNTAWTQNPTYAEIAQSGDEIKVTFKENINGYIYVREVNEEGKATTNTSIGYMVKIDKEIPTIGEITTITEDKEVKFNAKVSDKLSGLSAFAIQSQNSSIGWHTYTGTDNKIETTLLRSGIYRLWIRDVAGNETSGEEMIVEKDIEPPTGLIEIIAKGIESGENIEETIVVDANKVSGEKYTNEETVTIKIYAEDNQTAKEDIMYALYLEDDYRKIKKNEMEIEWNKYQEEVEFTLDSADGKQVIYVIFKDIAGNISMTTGRLDRDNIAYAVYSETDNSLTFFNRRQFIEEGVAFDGKIATAVYTGIEDDTYQNETDVPWYEYREVIKTVKMENTIAPVSTTRWFDNFISATSIDVSKLNTSKVTSMSCMFQKCLLLEELDISHFDTRNVTTMQDMFNECVRLQEVTLGAEFAFKGTNGYLPAPSGDYIQGADGYWYNNEINEEYLPSEIPSNTKATYVVRGEYKVTFDANGGLIEGTDESIITKTLITGGKFGDLGDEFPKATREGYIFDGWYTSGDKGVLINEDKVVDKTVKDIKIYAKWRAEYTVPNAPKLGAGMKAVYWDEAGTKIESSEYTDGMYDYKTGDGSNDTRDSMWANAITEDGSYWVWIPRYAYKITYYGNNSKTIAIGETTSTSEIRGDKSIHGDIDIIFMKGISNTEYIDADGKTKQLPEGYKVHPAFQAMEEGDKLNSLGKWDEELEGIWVAKFEASREISNDGGKTWEAVAGVNELTTNAGNESETLSRIVSKPSVVSWTNITENYIYQNSLEMFDEYNSHEMKNSELGAVTYLAYGPYGRNRNEVALNQCTGLITGGGKGIGENPVYGAGYSYSDETVYDENGEVVTYAFDEKYAWNTENGQLTSTTGNMYGVYDLVGGAWEYVASYVDNGHANISGEAYGGALGTSEDMKTKQVYPSTVSNGAGAQQADYELAREIYGDAVYEVSTSHGGTNCWNGTYSHFVSGQNPFFRRGGSFDDTRCGTVAYGSYYGRANRYGGFRTVLAITDTCEVTFDANGGVTEVANKKVKIEETYGELPIPERKGYEFIGWFTEPTNGEKIESNTMMEKRLNHTLYARWQANTNTTYIVEHWLQNIGGADEENETNYTKAADGTQICAGTTDTEVTPTVNTYDGFSSPIEQTITILGDGSGIVKYYYKRNSYQLTLTEGENIVSVSGTGTYQYDQEIAISAIPTTEEGYVITLDGWYSGDVKEIEANTVLKMPAYDLVLEARATKEKLIAFAIYSADDNSLTFYNKTNLVESGEIYNGKTATEVYVGLDTAEYAAAANVPWYNYRTTITSVKIEDEIMPISTAYWFNDFQNVSTITNVERLNTKNVKNMACMFFNFAYNTDTFDLDEISTWNVESVETFDSMFYAAGYKTNSFIMDLSSWKTISATNMTGMFYTCGMNATDWSIGDLSNWDTADVTHMTAMFARTGYMSKEWNLGDIGRWNVEKVTDMSFMFNAAGRFLTEFNLDLSNWKTNSLTNISYIFSGMAYYVETLNLNVSTWDTSKVTQMKYTFNQLGFEAQPFVLDLSSWNTRKVTVTSNMFTSCVKVKEIRLGADFTYTTLIPKPSSTYIPGADGKWYVKETGVSYTTIPSGRAGTYIAINPLVTYTVEHYLQTIDGADEINEVNYKKADAETQILSAMPNTEITQNAKDIAGFTAITNAQTVTVAADGSTLLKYYYKRNYYTLTLGMNSYIEEVSGAGTYRWGTEVDITAKLKEETGYTYSFDRWASNDTSLVLNQFEQNVTITMPIGDVTLTAEGSKTRNQYTVTLNANGGSVNPSSIVVSYGLTYEELPTPTKTGYNFLGWYTDATSGTLVNNTDTVTILAAQTLYARWELAFPSTPSSYSLINTYRSSTTYTAPKDGYYQIVLQGASGKGGEAYGGTQSSNYRAYVGNGAGGGGGGCAISVVKLKAGDTIRYTHATTGNTCTVTINSSMETYTTMSVSSGVAGEDCSGGSNADGSAGGSGTGGNYGNYTGGTGNDGEFKSYNGDSISYAGAAGGSAGYSGGNAGGTGEGIRAVWSVDYTKWNFTYTAATSGSPSFVEIYGGNTN